MKKMLSFVACVVLMTSSVVAAPLKVGVVDMAKVLFFYDEVKILRIEMSNREARYQTELNQMEKDIEELKKKLESNQVKEDEKQRMEKDFSRKMFNLQRKFEEYKKKLDEQKEAELEKVKAKVFKEIEKMSRVKRLDFVFDSRQLYFGKTLDLTEELIEHLNKKNAAGGLK
jgi:Skp family chaperone for outer membrane proteins